MNPFKVNKIQLGSSEQNPHITQTNNSLSFYDSTVGSVRLDQILGERSIESVITVSKSVLGSSYNTIQSAINSASSGDLIVIYNGEYSEALTIADKNLSFLCFGDVVLSSVDSTAITISSSTVSICDMKIKILNGLGNPIPYCISTSHTDATHSLTLKNCVLDTSEHLNARSINSSKVSFSSFNNIYEGLGDIEITASSKNYFLGAVFPKITLNSIVSDSHLVGHVSDIVLVSSDLTLSGTYVSCTGDVNSSLKKETVKGSVSFNNEDTVDVVFDCPLAVDNYLVLTQNLSSGEFPLVSNKSKTGFTLNTGNLITEQVHFTLVQ